MHGGEIVALDGSPLVLDPEQAVYRGHTEQNMAVAGHVTIDAVRHEIVGGTGYRDKSWGPRHWHSFFWYKWLPITFGPDFGVLLSIKGRPEGGSNRISGNVLKGGVYEPVIDGSIETVYDEAWIPQRLTARVRTAVREYAITGTVRATVPLRHRGADASSYTRITEGMSLYECDGRRVLGMTEYCDRIEHGVPISVALERQAA